VRPDKVTVFICAAHTPLLVNVRAPLCGSRWSIRIPDSPGIVKETLTDQQDCLPPTVPCKVVILWAWTNRYYVLQTTSRCLVAANVELVQKDF